MFKEKLEIAENLRISINRFSINYCISDKKVLKKCYRSYINQCIFLGRNSFELKFKGKYHNPLRVRVVDWLYYYKDVFKKYFFIAFTPKKYSHDGKYGFYKYWDIPKPYHVKISTTPHEAMLENFLEKNNFKTIKKIYRSDDTFYIIARI